ncbi:outer membrane efflux protein [Aneurinibacillus soli]|uniref:Outer membrane efflux protein n=1 Tax=Aneurinibacillus soli TaxID=1500254 RepID=A0A0U5BEG1_9BACL|nr:TolC family protein [Aneurinibacillus soli]PYE61519.1 outer membrane efflux protein [Aneurinibacillus soli]BAU26526.1 Outer membrane efflux protein [Aneurinibacillus soli]
MKKASSIILSACLLLPLAVPAYAAEVAPAAAAQQQGLTYQGAIDKALNKSLELKNIQADIDRSFEVKNNLGRSLSFVPTGPGNQGANSAYMGVEKAEIGYQMTQKQLEIKKDQIAYSTRKAYNAILQAQSKKQLALLTEKNSELQNNISFYKYQYGMASLVDSDRAQKNYAADKKNSQVAETNVSSSYQTFNQLVGLETKAVPQLAEKPDFKKLNESDLDNHIGRVIDTNPQVWLANKNIDLAQVDVKLLNYNSGQGESYDTKKLDLEKNQNTYANAKEQIDSAVRTLYYNILQIEDQYSVLEQKLEIAQDAYNTLKVQFDVGLATKADLSSARLSVEQLKQQLFELALNHDNLVEAYQKPWVLSAS